MVSFRRAGYSMRLNDYGETIRTLDYYWAKEPNDGGRDGRPTFACTLPA